MLDVLTDPVSVGPTEESIPARRRAPPAAAAAAVRAGLRHLRAARRGDGEAARPAAGRPSAVVRGADLLLLQPALGRRRARRRAGAAGLLGLRLRARGGRDHRPRRPRSRPRRAPPATSPATRSSTTGRRATSSSPRCRSGSGRRRARTPRSRSAPGSSPPTSSSRTGRRQARAADGRVRQRRAARRRHAREHGVVVRGARRLRLPRRLGPHRGTCSARAPAAAAASASCGGGRAGASRRRSQPGDVVSMTVEGIGTIENRVVEGVAPTAVPKARRRS